MRTAGIICECNPFHGGHRYLIDCARRSGAEAVICVMSGCFVQRGEAAIVDMHIRAKALLAGGADAVLELPFPYSAAGAEFFAAAGVNILERLGIDELWFGSECGDLAYLTDLAKASLEPAFLQCYAETAGGNGGTAEAYFACLCDYTGKKGGCLSNDILGISYLRAVLQTAAKIQPFTVKRQGSSYTATELVKREFPSATALRAKWRAAGAEAILPYLPASVHPIYASVKKQQLADLSHAERAILADLRLMSSVQTEEIAELSGGLGNRLRDAAQKATGYAELLSLAATKKYPTARLQRGILFAMTDIKPQDLRTEPAYVRLLAANAVGCRFLAACRKGASVPIVTRKADLPNTAEALRQAEWERRAFALYTLCYPEIRGGEELWKTAALIET